MFIGARYNIGMTIYNTTRRVPVEGEIINVYDVFEI